MIIKEMWSETWVMMGGGMWGWLGLLEWVMWGVVVGVGCVDGCSIWGSVTGSENLKIREKQELSQNWKQYKWTKKKYFIVLEINCFGRENWLCVGIILLHKREWYCKIKAISNKKRFFPLQRKIFFIISFSFCVTDREFVHEYNFLVSKT